MLEQLLEHGLQNQLEERQNASPDGVQCVKLEVVDQWQVLETMEGHGWRHANMLHVVEVPLHDVVCNCWGGGLCDEGVLVCIL